MIWGGFVVLVLDILLQTVFRGQISGVENKGVSFGLAPEVGNILAVITFVVLVVWILQGAVKHRKDNFPVELFLLGAVGNLTARFIVGSIWDYICLPFLPFCFNLSDVLITLGVVSYILRGINENRRTV